MTQLSDEELLDWIDEFVEDELKQVLKYLILLNAEAVQKAMMSWVGTIILYSMKRRTRVEMPMLLNKL